MATPETVVNVRRFIYEAVANGCFPVQDAEEVPQAQLDGEPFDYVAMLYAVIGAMGTGNELEVPASVSRSDYDRARDLIREAQ